MKKLRLSIRETRHKRIRKKIKGTSFCPRLTVFRSNKHIFVQLIDDNKGKTIISASDIKKKIKGNKTEVAKKIGVELAKMAKEKKIEKVVFDRGGYKYHGRIKAVAEGAREEGLKF